MHKTQSPTAIPPVRTTVSALNTFNYQLAKYLCSLLQPPLPNTYSLSDTFSFVQKLKTVDMSNKLLISFDVVSLFTNIPFKESIYLAVSYIAEGNPIFKLSKNDLTKLFSFAKSQTNFLFNGKMYDQTHGVAMGSPLAPVLANLFLGHYENIWLNNYQGPSVHFYRRYVDDTFCLFNTEHDALLFFEFINSQHPNVKLTVEKETNEVLAFLDVCINNNDPCSLLTSVHRKKTYSGLLTNFFSFTSYSYKIGLIRTLLDRAYKINTTLAKLNDDVKKLFHIFKRN